MYNTQMTYKNGLKIDLWQILGNHCFYGNRLGNLHKIGRGEMTHTELDCAVLQLFFFNLHFSLLIHLLNDE